MSFVADPLFVLHWSAPYLHCSVLLVQARLVCRSWYLLTFDIWTRPTDARVRRGHTAAANSKSCLLSNLLSHFVSSGVCRAEASIWSSPTLTIKPALACKLSSIKLSLSCIQKLELFQSSINHRSISIITECIPNLRALDISLCPYITDESLRLIAQLPRLQTLEMADCNITSKGIHYLSNSRHLIDDNNIIENGKDCIILNLTHLNLSDTSIADEACTELAKFVNLTNLQLSDCDKITDNGIIALATLRKLVGLQLDGLIRMTDEGINSIVDNLPNLKELNIQSCDNVSGEGLSRLCFLPKLSHLSLGGRTSQICDADLHPLQLNENIKHINLYSCFNIGDTGILYLCQIPDITYLNLTGCLNITNSALLHIAKQLNGIKTLKLAGNCNIDDEGVRSLLANPHIVQSITNVDVSSCTQLTDLTLKCLSQCQQLYALDISHNANVSDVGIAYLASISNMGILTLDNCINLTNLALRHLCHLQICRLDISRNSNIDEDAIPIINTMPNIRIIDLSYTNMSDQALYLLQTNSTLRSINIEGCEKITLDGLGHIQHIKHIQTLLRDDNNEDGSIQLPHDDDSCVNLRDRDIQVQRCSAADNNGGVSANDFHVAAADTADIDTNDHNEKSSINIKSEVITVTPSHLDASKTSAAHVLSTGNNDSSGSHVERNTADDNDRNHSAQVKHSSDRDVIGELKHSHPNNVITTKILTAQFIKEEANRLFKQGLYHKAVAAYVKVS